MPSVSRLIGDVWKSFDSEGGRRPACILSFSLPNDAFDVNLSPDKRQVMFTEESMILTLIKEALLSHWSEQSEGRFEANEVENRTNITAKGGSSAATSHRTKSEMSPEGEVLNKITPKSTRRRNGEIELPVADKLSSLATKDKTIITPTVTQTQVDDSAEKDTDKEAACENKSNIVQVRSTKVKEKDQRAWEQMKLSFNRIDRTQKQKEMAELLLTNKSTESETKIDAATLQSNEMCVDNPSSLNSNSTPDSIKKLPKNNTSSFLDQFAFEKTKTKAKKAEAIENIHGSSTSDLTTAETSDVERTSVRVQCKSHLKRKMEDPSAVSLGDFASGTTTDSDKEEDVENQPWDEKESLARRKARAEELAKKSGRMITSERILSSKRLQPMLGRAREKEKANRSVDNTCSQKCPKRDRSDTSVPDKNEREPTTIWDSFSGTQSAVAQSRQFHVQMRKRRKALRDNLDSDDIKAKEATFAVKLCHEDFLHMSIIGQFNLGFILARCRNQNLWILDQHACDEKYNFERLCKETAMHEQKLITPLQLELSPSEEHCIIEHMDVFERNGFRFHYNAEKESRRRLSLTALPHSGSGGDGTKAVQFGKEGMAILQVGSSNIILSTHRNYCSFVSIANAFKDVGALCAMLGADGTTSDGHVAGFGTGADGSGIYTSHAVRRFAGVDNTVIGSSIVRLPKAIAMFASRACRVSHFNSQICFLVCW